MRELIQIKFMEVLEQIDSKLSVDKITDDMILLESGLDSLGFAILVATLEEELDFDPFSIMKEAIYPNTFGEFVNMYEKFNPNN